MTESDNAIDSSSLGPRLPVSILLTLIIGVALSFGAFFFGRSLEHDKAKANFLQAAKTHAVTLAGGIELKLHTLTAIRSFYAASKEEVDRSEFRAFVGPLLSTHSGIQALEWIPRVLDDQRAAYEKAAQQDGLLDFQITERMPQGVMARAKQREEYFPVYFVEPLKGNEAAVGFDLASNPTRLETLKRSRDTGKILSTARITLVQETGKQSGFLVFLPVYVKGVSLETVKDRREHLKGFALGVFRIGDIIESSLDFLGWGGIDVSLYDLSAPEDKRFLHAYHSHQTPEVDGRISKEVTYSSGMQYAETIDVAGRKWKILCEAEPAYISSGKTWLPWGLLVSGLSITLLITINLLSFAKRNMSISKTYRKLEAEVDQRIKSERTSEKVRKYAESVVNTVREPLVSLDYEFKVISANDSFYKTFMVTKEDTIGNLLYDLGNRQWNIPRLRKLLEEVIPQNKEFVDFEVEHKFESIGKKNMLLNARMIFAEEEEEEEEEEIILLAIEDVTERVEATQKVKRIAVELTQLIDTANAPIFGVDTEGKINEWNQMVANITGYGKDEVVGQNLVEQYITGEYKAPVKEVLDNALKGTETGNYEVPLYTKDGERVMVLLNATTRRDADGNIIGVVGVGQDITELSEFRSRLEALVKDKTQDLNQSLADTEQAREELLESERQLRLRNRIADIFLTRSDTDMFGDVLDVILDVMASKYGFFGYINEDGDMVAPSMTKEIFDECQMHDKDILFPRRDWGAMWGQTLLEKKTLYANKGLHLPEGHVPLTRRMTVPIIYQEELAGILAIADKETDYDEKDREMLEAIAAHIAPILQARLQRDIEERTRREAEKKLQESLADTEQARDSIDGILKSVADGLIVTDIYNRVVMMNRAAEDLLGVRFSQVIDRPIDFAIKEKLLRTKVRETLDKKTTGHQFDFELPGDDPKHSKIMRARTSVIFDSEGKEAGIVTIIHDVTHEREVDRMKTEFISTAAHELRTPLTSIQGFSEILLMRDDLKSKEKKKYLGYINKQAVGLAAIINDLLDISRIESGHSFELNKVPCNAGDAIHQIIPYFQENYKEHRFEVTLPKKAVQLIVDKEKMGQVLKNLLSNAAKYSPDGGLIRVVGEVLANHYQISIEDEGIGMTPEQVAKIFDKFYRADASDTAIEGTGLG